MDKEKLKEKIRKLMKGFDKSSNFGKLKLEILDDINTKLPENFLIKFIEASTVTEDNSNLYQVAELYAQKIRNNKEWWIFDSFLWISDKPYKYGVALYYKL
jgi:RecA/RadA recombinase